MSEGRGRTEWARTSCVLAMLANGQRDPKKSRRFKPADFDPYAARARREGATEVSHLAELKAAFTGRRANSCSA